ncbi:uncharacterized protein [Chironomus tepperi]|uniref:uncharacterized protein n=1 Tax=Chironomus tepperi TaxID=113505 RepID=UPI00391F020C
MMIEAINDNGSCNIDGTNEIHEHSVIPMKNIKSLINASNTNVIKCVKYSNNIVCAVESLESDVTNTQHAVLIQFIIEENFKELNQDQLDMLAQIFSTKAVVLFFKSKDCNSMLIYWKSRNIDYFLTLMPPKRMTILECEEVYEFVADFLVESLDNGQLGIQRNHTHSAESNKIDLLQLANSKNLNILQQSVELNDTKCVKSILNLGIFKDTPYQLDNPPSIALINKNFSILLMLMEANFTYPPFMDITKVPTEIQQHVQVCEDLHDAVTAKNIPKIDEILKLNPKFRHFYNKNNQSVLKVALEKKLYSMYEVLLSNDITFGPHEHFERVFAGLNENDKTILREIHFRCSKDLPEHHMNVLMMNTSISHDDMEYEGKEELVLRAYRFLNKNPHLNPILKVVAASRRFNIIFDFKRKSVAAVDPTAPPDMRGFFYLNGKICVGAEQLLDVATEHETFGTLAHELCHYAANLTFRNFAKPYAKNDKKSSAEFREVFEFCKEHSGREEIIDLAFKEPPAVQKAEVIVRAAHLIAMYDNQPDKLADLQDFYAVLFNFYTQKVLPAMTAAIPNIRRKADVEIKEKDKKIFNLTRNFYIAIGLGIIIAALVGFIVYRPTYKFEELTPEQQDKVRNAFVSYRNVSVQFKELFRNDSSAYGKLTSEHITDMLGGVVLDFDDSRLMNLDAIVRLDWTEMPEKLKDKFMESEADFQGQNVKFGIFNDSDAFVSLTSSELINTLKQIPLKIGQTPKLTADFYIDRKFLPEDAKLLNFEYQFGHDYKMPEGLTDKTVQELFVQTRTQGQTFQRFCNEFFKNNSTFRDETFKKVRQNSFFVKNFYNYNHQQFLFMHESSKEIIKKAEKDKIFVLSSDAGAGKTITFEHLGIEIKEMYPSKWVAYVDLKGHVGYYKYEESNGIKPNSDYFTSKNVINLLKNIVDFSDQKSNFEVRIFEKSFDSGNLVLIWNGFDEISSESNSFVLNLMNFINKNTSNVQYICTRPLYSDLISKTFDTRPYQLVPLDANGKKSFLKSYFISQGIKSGKTDENIEKVDENIQKVDENIENVDKNIEKDDKNIQKVDKNIQKVDENIQKVEKIIEKLQNSQSVPQDFNTPLMLKLVAEVYIDNLLIDSGNTYGIYETFIMKKIRIWLQKGESAHKMTGRMILYSHKYNFMDIYQKYAFLDQLNLFLSTTLAMKLQKLQIMQKEIPKDLEFDKISEMGILYINGKNKFEFAHKTFAEFFIARYFIENIYNVQEDVQEDEAELRLELFFRIMKTYGDRQTVIIDFMDSHLETNNDKKDVKFNPVIADLLRTKFKKFLFRLLDTNHPKIYEFLFKFFSKDHDLLVDLLHVHQPETLYTAIFNPGYFALAVNPENIKNISKKYLNPSEFQSFITGIDQKGMFYYGLYFYEDVDAAKFHPDHSDFIKQFMYDTYWTFMQNIQIYLTDAEQKEMFIAAVNPKIYLYYNRVAAFFEGFEQFGYGYADMWGRYEELLTRNETKDVLGDALIQYNEINPCDKKGSDEMMTTLISYIEELNLDDKEVLDMFISKNILHESHFIAVQFEKVWTYLSSHTTMQQRRDILLQDDLDDKNFYLYSVDGDKKQVYARNSYFYYIYDFTPFKVLHRAFIIPSGRTFNQTIQIYAEHFNKYEIQDMIVGSNDFLYYFVDTADTSDFQDVVDYFLELFKGNETKLMNYLDRKIKPTKFNIFGFIENLRDLPQAFSRWFDNLDVLRVLKKKINV